MGCCCLHVNPLCVCRALDLVRKMDRLVKCNGGPLEKLFVTDTIGDVKMFGVLKDSFRRRWKDECLLKLSRQCSKKCAVIIEIGAFQLE